MPDILYVEDEYLLREYVARFLEEEGFAVTQAENGEVALRQIETDRPDLVLCDISMPVMGGYELLTALRSDPEKFGDLPFILLSAHVGLNFRLEGLSKGADDFLTKPIDFDVLLARINAVLESRRT